MNSFYKNFLIDSPLGTSATNHSVVFAFGKHPGWDDHIQDVGIANDSIALAKRILYVNGIGGIIDSGGWERAGSEKNTVDFDHTFVWLRKDELLIGRLWPSTDGKGRSKYPMIIGCHLKKVSIDFAFREALPHLTMLETRCRSFSQQSEVLTAFKETQSSLCRLLDKKSKGSRDQNQTITNASMHGRSLLPEIDEIEDIEESWTRIFYQIKNQLENYSHQDFKPKRFTDKEFIRAGVLRLPLVDQSFEKSVEPWLRFLQTQVSVEVPLLFFASQQTTWCDIVVGEPSKRELINLKSSLETFPYPYQIPYSINDEFKAKARTVIHALTEGKPTAKTYVFDSSPSRISRTAAPQKKSAKWIFILGGILLISVIVIYFAA